MTKDFNNWNIVKQKLQTRKLIHFRQCEIYFISIGQNIGYEVFGKAELFLRPVLVYKKLSKYTFIGIPLTSKVKQGSYFFNFSYKKDISSTALLNQIRVFDIRRNSYFHGKIKLSDFRKVESKLIQLLKITLPKEEFEHSQKELLKYENIISNKNQFVNFTNTKSSILVTGAAGFIGSNFVPYFLQKYQNYNIVVLD